MLRPHARRELREVAVFGRYLVSLSILCLPSANVAGAAVLPTDVPVLQPEYVNDGAEVLFDPAGLPVVVHGGGSLELTRFNGSSWDKHFLEESYCYARFPSAVWGPSGELLVAYASLSHIRLVRWDGTTTSSEFVGIGTSPSLRLHPAGYPCVSYSDTSDDDDRVIRYACDDGTGWSYEDVYRHTGWATSSLAFGPSGEPEVALMDTTDKELRYARRTAGVWSIELVPSVLGLRPSLQLDGSGLPVVAYLQTIAWQTYSTAVARHDGASWSTTGLGFTVGDIDYQPDLVLDLAEQPIVVTRDSASALVAAQYDGSSWSVQEIEAGHGTAVAGIALDPAGEPAVAYASQGDEYGGLQVARRASGVWSIEQPRPRRGADRWTSLAIDAAGAPMLAYSDARDDALMLSRWTGSDWLAEDVGARGRQPSLVLDPRGQPAIAFREQFSWLSLARFDGASWSVETIDTADGSSPSLGFDLAGHPMIAYTDGPRSDAKFARHDGTAWSTEILDETPGAYMSAHGLAVDSIGTPWVLYRYSPDRTDPVLKLAHHDGIDWVYETIGAGTGGAIAVDSADRPAVVINTSTGMSYAVRSAPGTWTSEPLSSDRWSSLTLRLNAADEPRIGYFHEGAYLARKVGTSWRSKHLPSFSPSMVLYDDDTAGIVVHRRCKDSLDYVDPATSALLALRAPVMSLAPGWKAAHLPLDASNDDETAPFPAILEGAPLLAPETGSAPLVLYRGLLNGAGAGGNALLLTRAPGGVVIEQ